MFPTAHPDITGQLANERAAGLRAAADRYRFGRPFLARWRPARIVEPTADLSRVVPAEPPRVRGRPGCLSSPARPWPRERHAWLVAWPACWPPGPG